MLIGTDMPIFGGTTHPCISLRLRYVLVSCIRKIPQFSHTSRQLLDHCLKMAKSTDCATPNLQLSFTVSLLFLILHKCGVKGEV
jgi:hypothetical protein